MFIKLTESFTDGRHKMLILNTADIMHIQERNAGKDTHVRMNKLDASGKMSYYFVTEKCEDIWNMIRGVPIPVGIDEFKNGG